MSTDLEKIIEQNAHDGAGSYAIAYALPQVAKAISGTQTATADAGNNIAEAIDGLTDALKSEDFNGEISAEGMQAMDEEAARSHAAFERGLGR